MNASGQSKSIAFVALLFFAVVWPCRPAGADPGGTARRPFGLGGMIGHPSGASAKYFFADAHAFDAAVGVGLFGGPGFHVHADYLFHLPLARARKFYVLFFVGAGVSVDIWGKDGSKYFGGKKQGRAGLGIRVPVGVAFHIKKVPLDPFAEVAPGLGLLPGPGFAIAASAGIRYYF